MPPRRKKSKITYAEDDEEIEEAPPPPPPEEEDDDDGDTGPVDRRASSGSKRSRDEDDEFQGDHLAEEDEDEDEDEDARADAAERRLAGRIAREDAEDASSAGLIKEIYCENFMCHKKLEIKLGRRINFINGANGSGKSAILAAMQICLGASAKQTHRGNKLGDLVREGSDATAEVVVKLVNEGTDAFRHETYGDTIGIRRRFGRKGGGKLDMLNENDEKVTSDRKELRSLLDSLKISVDNPVCVLDQENSKHFIRGKAKDKYKFFLRATEIEDVMNRITRCTSAADKCISDAEHQRGKLESFARLAQNAQREYEEVMRLAKYDEEIRDLKVLVRRPCRVAFDGVEESLRASWSPRWLFTRSRRRRRGRERVHASHFVTHAGPPIWPRPRSRSRRKRLELRTTSTAPRNLNSYGFVSTRSWSCERRSCSRRKVVGVELC